MCKEPGINGMKLIVIRIIGFITTITLSSFIFAQNEKQESYKFPVSYKVEHGIYTMPVLIGNPPHSIEVIVDTGSSTLVVIPEKKICSHCDNPLTKGFVEINALKPSSTSSKYVLKYGSATDRVIEFYAQIQGYKHKNPIIPEMQIFVIEDSTQPSNILGLLKENISIIPNAQTFVKNVHKYHNLHRVITFVLCGEGADSYIEIGPEYIRNVTDHQNYESPMTHKNYYEIQSSGFFDDKGNQIAKPVLPFVAAVLDTGTGGYVILNENLHSQILKYIFEHAGKKNQALGEPFWKNNYCVPLTDLDFKSLPKIKIGFQRKDDPSSYYLLDLEPDIYVNKAGCGNDSARLVFIRSLPPHPTAWRNAKQRERMKYFPAMILGSSFMNQYVMQFHLTDNDPYVTFIPNKNICHKPGKDK